MSAIVKACIALLVSSFQESLAFKVWIPPDPDPAESKFFNHYSLSDNLRHTSFKFDKKNTVDKIAYYIKLGLGRLSGKASCYAAVVLADSATFSLAVNSMVAFAHSPQTCHTDTYVISRRFLSWFVPTWAYAVITELSYLGSGERATPIPHSLRKISCQ